jgi:uncharacterized repeat protein (TIGR03803 family)
MQRCGSLKRACIVLALCVAATIGASAQTFTTLVSFDGTNGHVPSSLIQGTDGNLYGTTGGGGATIPCPNGNDSYYGCGTIFEITPAGVLTTLHSFNGTDGSGPGNLVQGTDGKFYGTTGTGGVNGFGTIFSIVPGGTLVTLYNFCSQPSCADGQGPTGLVQGTDGNFYGTTNGSGSECTTSCGTLFEITPVGALTTLYTFSGPGTTYAPSNVPAYEPSGVVQGTDGNFYGPAFGGTAMCSLGGSDEEPDPYCGTIFKVTPEGALTTLYGFCTQPSCTDGFFSSGLVQGSDGNFYGTTEYGGSNLCGEFISLTYASCGTVFQITPEGTLTTLHIFDGTDGALPSGVIQGSDGNFYGTMWYGGANGVGTLFKITPAGTLATLYSFSGIDIEGDTYSADPGKLVQAPNAFYGLTGSGANDDDGTVFSFSLGVGGTTPSTTSLSLSPASIAVGSAGPVVLTATVAPASGSGTPTGVVAFYNGTSELGPADLSGGVAAYDYNPSGLALDPYQITAMYLGDSTFAQSTSSAQTLTVTSSPPAATPLFSPASGSYNSAQTVTITGTTRGATIYFTNDGTTPTTSSEVYNGAITVDSTETINAIAGASGYSTSAMATATYTVNLAPDYQLSATPTALTIVAGQSGTATFALTPMNGFNSQVSFTCSGLPSEATCSFAPTSVTPTDGKPVSSILTVTTTGASAALRGPGPSSRYLGYALLIPCLGMIVGVATRQKRALRGLRVFSMLTLVALAAALTSCGSSSKAGNSGTPSGMSTATVTASTSAAISHSATLTITITQ